MRKARAVNEALAEAGPPQIGVVRPKTKARLVVRNGYDAAIAEHFDYAKIIDDAVVIELPALSRTNVAGVESWSSRNFLLPIDQRRADRVGRLEQATLPE